MLTRRVLIADSDPHMQAFVKAGPGQTLVPNSWISRLPCDSRPNRSRPMTTRSEISRSIPAMSSSWSIGLPGVNGLEDSGNAAERPPAHRGDRSCLPIPRFRPPWRRPNSERSRSWRSPSRNSGFMTSCSKRSRPDRMSRTGRPVQVATTRHRSRIKQNSSGPGACRHDCRVADLTRLERFICSKEHAISLRRKQPC